jgi:hypothetical protein
MIEFGHSCAVHNKHALGSREEPLGTLPGSGVERRNRS